MTYLSNSGGCSYGCGSCSSGASGYSVGMGSYSTIDSVVSSYSGSMSNALETAVDYDRPMQVINMDNPGVTYSKGEGEAKEVKGYNMPYNKGYATNSNARDYFSPSIFLRDDRPQSQFIGKVEEIKHYIQEAFKATTGKELPEDISIIVVNQEELKQRHELCNGTWSPGIQGISINRKGFGQSLIVVKENDLDILMMTIGHEIGHVLNFQLNNRLNEEAKAFAFEMAWVKSIFENNIAGLRNSIDPDPKPARNGLHDVAFAFVKRMLLLGKDAFDVFRGLLKGEFSVGEVAQCTG